MSEYNPNTRKATPQELWQLQQEEEAARARLLDAEQQLRRMAASQYEQELQQFREEDIDWSQYGQ